MFSDFTYFWMTFEENIRAFLGKNHTCDSWTRTSFCCFEKLFNIFEFLFLQYSGGKLGEICDFSRKSDDFLDIFVPKNHSIFSSIYFYMLWRKIWENFRFFCDLRRVLICLSIKKSFNIFELLFLQYTGGKCFFFIMFLRSHASFDMPVSKNESILRIIITKPEENCRFFPLENSNLRPLNWNNNWIFSFQFPREQKVMKKMMIRLKTSVVASQRKVSAINTPKP